MFDASSNILQGASFISGFLICLQADSKITSTSSKSIERKCRALHSKNVFSLNRQKNKDIQPEMEKD